MAPLPNSIIDGLPWLLLQLHGALPILFLALLTVIPPGKLRSLAVWLSIAATAQVGLGIATVLSVVALPVAVAHQGCAVVLLSVLLRFMHVLKHA